MNIITKNIKKKSENNLAWHNSADVVAISTNEFSLEVYELYFLKFSISGSCPAGIGGI